MNKVIIQGFLGQDPELIYTKNGKALVNISIASRRKYKDQNGEKITDWHRIVFWGVKGETINKFFKKGDQIIVDGELIYDEWNDNNGNKVRTAKINGEEFSFCGNNQNNGQSNQNNGQNYSGQQNNGQNYSSQQNNNQQQPNYQNNQQPPQNSSYKPHNSKTETTQPSQDFDDDIPF